jgi:transposase
MPAPLVLPRGYSVRSVGTDGTTTQIVVVTSRRSARCPLCHRRSRRVHSRYWRVLADLPANGEPVCLRVQARRFFCRTEGCSSRIFAEPLADLAGLRARGTDRLKGNLQQIGFVLGGRPGSRLAEQIQMPASRSTLLRLVAAAALPEAPTPQALGVDDWAFRRGHRYGTILVDLRTHRPVDLLSERSAEALARWLRDHPGVEVIARDRSGTYAEGARQGAPGAIQVADRWHLLKNLVDALERYFNSKPGMLQAAAREETLEPPAATTEPPPPRHPDARERERLARRHPRLARYEQIRALAQEGHSFREIARRMGVARATVTRYVGAEIFPEIAQRVKTPSQLDPYRAHIE